MHKQINHVHWPINVNHSWPKFAYGENLECVFRFLMGTPAHKRSFQCHENRRNCRLFILGRLLTLSLPITLTLYTLPYWSNPPFLVFDIRALWPECQKLKNAGLDQYVAEPFKQQQFGTAGNEGVKKKGDTDIALTMWLRLVTCLLQPTSLCSSVC